MNAKDIVGHAMAWGLVHTTGLTPENTMGANINVDINKHRQKSKFYKPAPGMFHLRQFKDMLDM